MYRWKLLMVSYHFPMFGGDWSSAKVDLKYLICHVTSQNDVIDRSSNFMSGSSTWYIITLPCLVVTGNVVVKI